MSQAVFPSEQELELERIDGIDSVQVEWARLARASGNIFATWEWASTWMRHFLGDRPSALYACRGADGELVAIVPLYLAATRPIRLMRLIGHGPADQLGPICDARDAPRVARALRSLVGRRPLGASALLVDRLPGDQGWPELLRAPRLRRESSPLLRSTGSSWEEFLQSRSRKLRAEIRHDERKLIAEHDLSFRLADDPERLEKDFTTLVELHGLRWGTGVGNAFAGPREAFHRDFARLALDRGWLRLWVMELAGAPAGVWYGWRFANADSYYNAGRDPAWRSYSIGLVLLAHTIRVFMHDGLSEYRFLLGPEPYKHRFANVDQGLDTVVMGRGPVGKVASVGAAVAAALPPGTRRRLASLAGGR